MIKFSLKCIEEHVFDSWFRSSVDYEKLDMAGMLSCPICGSTEVKKNVMTPQVRSSSEKKSPPQLSNQSNKSTNGEIRKKIPPDAKSISELRRLVETKFENVGRNFAEEARDIHDGLAPQRSIVGEATINDAIELLEDGIPVAPCPWSNSQKPN